MAETIDSRNHEKAKRKYLLRRFWSGAAGFWRPDSRGHARVLTTALIAIVILQVIVHYRINVWNRSIFDALEQKQAAEVLWQALIFVPLAISSILLAVVAVYGRMTTQRNWRRWLSDHIIDRWLTHGRYFHLYLVKGDADNPDYRIAEDV